MPSKHKLVTISYGIKYVAIDWKKRNSIQTLNTVSINKYVKTYAGIIYRDSVVRQIGIMDTLRFAGFSTNLGLL